MAKKARKTKRSKSRKIDVRNVGTVTAKKTKGLVDW